MCNFIICFDYPVWAKGNGLILRGPCSAVERIWDDDSGCSKLLSSSNNCLWDWFREKRDSFYTRWRKSYVIMWIGYHFIKNAMRKMSSVFTISLFEDVKLIILSLKNYICQMTTSQVDAHFDCRNKQYLICKVSFCIVSIVKACNILLEKKIQSI